MFGCRLVRSCILPAKRTRSPTAAFSTIGGARVASPGVVRYRMNASPPNPAGWTQYNSNALLEIHLRGNGNEIVQSTGTWLGDTTEGTMKINGPCMVEAVMLPPHSHGVYGGEYPAQTASCQLEFIANNGEDPAAYGEILRNGDRISTRNAKALLHLGEGTHILMRRDTQLRLVTTEDGALRGEVEAGSVHVIKRPGQGRKLEFRFGPRTICKPTGTIIDAYVNDDEGYVRVEEGEVETETATGIHVIKAGWQLDLEYSEIGPLQPSFDTENDFDGWPIEDIPYDPDPVPTLNITGDFSPSGDMPGGRPGGWTWLARKSSPEVASDSWSIDQGTLVVKSRPDAQKGPRIWRGVTGDFELSLEFSIETNPGDHAWISPFIFAVGSDIGREMKFEKYQVGFKMDTAILASFGFRKQFYASSESDGSFHNPNDIIPGDPKRLWIRVSRRNADITVSMSPDGRSWSPVSFRSFAELPETLWVGVSFSHRSGDSFAQPETGNVTRIYQQQIRSAGR